MDWETGMDRLDSAQNTPQDAEQIDEEILADNDPAASPSGPVHRARSRFAT